ncbi:hypothetical protein ACTPEM_26000, partial [Clostridioides difficile]
IFSLFAFSALFNALNCREFGLNSTIPNFFKNKLALQIIVVTGKEYQALREMCFLAKNLYNVGTYNVRQHYFNQGEHLNYEANYH